MLHAINSSRGINRGDFQNNTGAVKHVSGVVNLVVNGSKDTIWAFDSRAHMIVYEATCVKTINFSAAPDWDIRVYDDSSVGLPYWIVGGVIRPGTCDFKHLLYTFRVYGVQHNNWIMAPLAFIGRDCARSALPWMAARLAWMTAVVRFKNK